MVAGWAFSRAGSGPEFPRQAQSSPPQAWLKNVQIRQKFKLILTQSGQPQFYESVIHFPRQVHINFL